MEIKPVTITPSEAIINCNIIPSFIAVGFSQRIIMDARLALAERALWLKPSFFGS